MGAVTGKTGYRYVIQRLTLILVWAVLLFVAAGTLHWIRGWVWVISSLLLEIGTLIVLAKRAPETLNQRGTWHAGVKIFEKLFIFCWLLIGELITPVIAGLDKRFEWSHTSMATFYCGIILAAFAWPFGTWAMVANEHFEQFIRIQTDRKHQVVTSGPYRIIRHPGYGAVIVGAIAMPLILGTWWTFVPAGAMILLFIVRTAIEDRTLRRELEGYEAYAQQIRYRLFPGVW
jgi:protein-S-isoprenylcysteine O-methyltransferase Ste14